MKGLALAVADEASAIAKKLQLDKPLSSEVIDQTRSALRTLKHRYKLGTFEKGDSELKRACAVMEYMTREHDGVKIPISQLAKAACMSEKKFVHFHGLVGNFLENIAPSSKSNNNTSKTSNPTIVNDNESFLLSMAVKFGTFVQDPHGVAVRAQQLMEHMYHHAKTKLGKSDRNYQLLDMEKHKKAYEAACFYLAATKYSDSSKRQLQSHHHDDDDSNQLQITNIVDGLKIFTMEMFQNVLKYIRSIIDQNDETPLNNLSKIPQDKQQKGRKKETQASIIQAKRQIKHPEGAARFSSKRSKSGDNSTKTNGESSSTLDFLNKVQEDRRGMPLNDDHGQFEPMKDLCASNSFEPKFSTGFGAWKAKTLTKAIDDAKEALKLELGDSGDTNDISRAQALARAATAILKKHNLVQ